MMYKYRLYNCNLCCTLFKDMLNNFFKIETGVNISFVFTYLNGPPNILQTSTNVLADHVMQIMEYVPILLDRLLVHVLQDTLVMDLLVEVKK